MEVWKKLKKFFDKFEGEKFFENNKNSKTLRKIWKIFDWKNLAVKNLFREKKDLKRDLKWVKD